MVNTNRVSFENIREVWNQNAGWIVPTFVGLLILVTLAFVGMDIGGAARKTISVSIPVLLIPVVLMYFLVRHQRRATRYLSDLTDSVESLVGWILRRPRAIWTWIKSQFAALGSKLLLLLKALINLVGAASEFAALILGVGILQIMAVPLAEGISLEKVVEGQFSLTNLIKNNGDFFVIAIIGIFLVITIWNSWFRIASAASFSVAILYFIDVSFSQKLSVVSFVGNPQLRVPVFAFFIAAGVVLLLCKLPNLLKAP